eukprot:1436589-Pyramimonas_sp.AAC.1
MIVRAIWEYLDTRAQSPISARAEHRFVLCYFAALGRESSGAIVTYVEQDDVESEEGGGGVG